MAKQLARAAFGWMDPLGTFHGRRLRIGEGRGTSSPSDLSQVVLAHPPHRFSRLWAHLLMLFSCRI